MTQFLRLCNSQCVRKGLSLEILRTGHSATKEILGFTSLVGKRFFSVSSRQTIKQKVLQAVCVRPLTGSMAESVHTAAKDGFKEGAFYDQSRPSYTDELVSCVLNSLHTGPNEGVKYNILELGAGTGKFTSKVISKMDKDSRYLATEPSEGFLSVLKENVSGVETMLCSATDIPLPNNSVQNIICAQCFHWFATEESMTEMTRVLVPDGRVVMVWNNKDWTVEWINAIEDILTDYYDDTPRAINRTWKTAIEAFTPLTEVEHKFLPGISNMKGDKNFLVDHFCSISVIAKQGASQQEAVRTRFRNVLDKYFKDDQEISIPFQSEFYCAKKS